MCPTLTQHSCHLPITATRHSQPPPPHTHTHSPHAGINWAALHQSRAPYTPRVDHELDTQNFEQFDEDMANAGAAGSAGRAPKWQTRAADPHFIGYTYKNWEAVHSDGAAGQVGGVGCGAVSPLCSRVDGWLGDGVLLCCACISSVCRRGRQKNGACAQLHLTVAGSSGLHSGGQPGHMTPRLT